MNKKQTQFLIIGEIALFLGGAIYIFLRPGTYLAQLTPDYFWIKAVRATLIWRDFNFLKFFLADYLWALSLCCGLHLLFQPQRKGSFLCAGITVFYGTLLELMQYCGTIPGTGDLLDILMFILAGLTVIIINEKKEK